MAKSWKMLLALHDPDGEIVEEAMVKLGVSKTRAVEIAISLLREKIKLEGDEVLMVYDTKTKKGRKI